MKVLIQDPITLQYLNNLDGWITVAEGATVFEDSHTALEFCLAHGFGEMNVVLKFADGRYDVQVPVRFAETQIEHAAEMAV